MRLNVLTGLSLSSFSLRGRGQAKIVLYHLSSTPIRISNSLGSSVRNSTQTHTQIHKHTIIVFFSAVRAHLLSSWEY